VTYWPLTESQTGKAPAEPVRSIPRRSDATQSNPGHASPEPKRFFQTKSAPANSAPSKLPHAGQDKAISKQKRRPTLPGPSVTAPPSSTRTGGYLAIVSRRGARHVPTHGGMLRRRLMINASKFVLPAVAVLLLSTIALWPELNTSADRARFSFHGISASLDGARLTDAHYNGVDEHGRPYTVTAVTAIQHDADRIDMSTPNADMTLENGTWLDVRSKQGVYMRKDQQLDLSHDVVLYRDDGTTMTTDSATVAMKDGAASSSMPTHVEGPFGTLDATGFTTQEKGAMIQFWGPVRVELNGVSK
jgi:lipopolysaccharide export system protein LptC